MGGISPLQQGENRLPLARAWCPQWQGEHPAGPPRPGRGSAPTWCPTALVSGFVSEIGIKGNVLSD